MASSKHRWFEGQIAVVTGASSGIGRETALALAQHGARLALAARRVEPLQRLAEEIQGMGGAALVIPTDVTQQTQVDALIQRTLEQWGRVDVLIANAGQYIRCPTPQLNLEDMQASFAINFYGALYAVLATLPHMLRRKSGHIVLVTSLDGRVGLPPDGPYVAAKFALTGLGEVMRQELRPHGIHVTLVLPGRVDTPMIAHLKVPLISAKISAQRVAHAILRGIRKRKAEVIVPFQAYPLLFAHAISPHLSDWSIRTFHLEGWETPNTHSAA